MPSTLASKFVASIAVLVLRFQTRRFSARRLRPRRALRAGHESLIKQSGGGRGICVGPRRCEKRHRSTTAARAVRLRADVSQCPRPQVGFPVADLADLGWCRPGADSHRGRFLCASWNLAGGMYPYGHRQHPGSGGLFRRSLRSVQRGFPLRAPLHHDPTLRWVLPRHSLGRSLDLDRLCDRWRWPGPARDRDGSLGGAAV